MFDEKTFYDQIRGSKLFGPVFDAKEFQGVSEIIKDCKAAGWPATWTAYALATAYHETAKTMQPIKEYGGNAYYTKLYDVSGQNPARARKYGNTKVGDGAKYCGRGYVQLTWKVNYEKAGRALGVDLVNKPELALDPDIASDIMIQGMSKGWFSGKKLSDYFSNYNAGTIEKFRACRAIINGRDDDLLIANYAMKFQQALAIANWR